VKTSLQKALLRLIDLEVETATLVAIHQASREFDQSADCQSHVNKIREKRTKSSFPRKRESSVLEYGPGTWFTDCVRYVANAPAYLGSHDAILYICCRLGWRCRLWAEKSCSWWVYGSDYATPQRHASKPSANERSSRRSKAGSDERMSLSSMDSVAADASRFTSPS